MTTNQSKGNRGEIIAASWLVEKNYCILEKNWRFRNWEVDIIAVKGEFLCFFEVKTRHNLQFGYPEESITRAKMNNLMHAAEEYQYLHPRWKYIQFNILAIIMLNDAVKEIFLIEDVYF